MSSELFWTEMRGIVDKIKVLVVFHSTPPILQAYEQPLMASPVRKLCYRTFSSEIKKVRQLHLIVIYSLLAQNLLSCLE